LTARRLSQERRLGSTLQIPTRFAGVGCLKELEASGNLLGNISMRRGKMQVSTRAVFRVKLFDQALTDKQVARVDLR
jgi:hypothetical protein